MTEVQTRSLIAGIALVIGALVAALIWGRNAVDVVILAGLLWLIFDRVSLHERGDEATDRADQAIKGLDDVTSHLWGLEPASNGRHAKGRAS